MPPIRTQKKTPTPGPSRRRSISPLPNLADMWERTTNPPPQAVYSAHVQTRAQAQRGRSVTRKPNFSIVIDNSYRNIPLNHLGPGQTSPGRSYPFQGPNQTSAAQEKQDPEWTISDITSGDNRDQEELEWNKVKAPKSMVEMEKEIGKGKTKIRRLEEWNPTLKSIVKKR